MNTNIPLEIGKYYGVRNSRKGTFCMKVTELSDPFITGEITSGTADALLADNVRFTGESITIRDEHSHFTPIAAPKETAK